MTETVLRWGCPVCPYLMWNNISFGARHISFGNRSLPQKFPVNFFFGNCRFKIDTFTFSFCGKKNGGWFEFYNNLHWQEMGHYSCDLSTESYKWENIINYKVSWQKRYKYCHGIYLNLEEGSWLNFSYIKWNIIVESVNSQIFDCCIENKEKKHYKIQFI